MKILPVPGRWFRRGTSSTTTPRFFAGSPASPFAPTPHCRPIWSATSAGARSPISASVTTAMSPRVFSRTSAMSASMRCTAAGSRTCAKSFTYPVGAGSAICARMSSRGMPGRRYTLAGPTRSRLDGVQLAHEVEGRPGAEGGVIPVYTKTGQESWAVRRPLAVLAALLGAACGLGIHEPTGPCGEDAHVGPTPQQLAFVSDARFGQFDICLINVDGTAVAQLTTSLGNDSWPAWKPDGTRLAFQSYRTLTPGGGKPQADIFVINVDGTGET